MGAAFHWHAEQGGQVDPIGSLYWGPDITDAQVERELPALQGKGYRVERCADIEREVAELLAKGEVVARAKGRMEFGARSLGNRSILADPTREDVVRVINDMIKSRDFWMPFAPSILEEESDRYLVNPKGMAAPYMIITFDTTEHVGDLTGAVQPYDRTARPQVVQRAHNPEYHRLISHFADKTGRGAVLNTSFNLHGYPIVNDARDAIDVLERSGLQHLAVANHLISKPGA
jgi:carbamoyltransferase